MNAHEHVRKALQAGWTAACDGLIALSWYRMRHPRHPERGEYRTLSIRAGSRSVEITISPSGRSVSVYVDGRAVE